jgi:putative addiction module component (TIGR02574 family)
VYNPIMGADKLIADALALSPDERMLLIERLWDSLAACPERIVLTDGQRRELERRLDACRRDPDAASPWDVVKSRLLPDS